MEHVRVRMSENGRILIPAEIRKQLGMTAGSTLTLEVDGEELHLLTRRARIRAAQASVARYVPEGVSLVEELIAERREEARKELAGE